MKIDKMWLIAYIPNKAEEEEFGEKGERKGRSCCSAKKRRRSWWRELVNRERWDLPVEEERGREKYQSGKSIGVDDEDEVIHSSGHGCFTQCGQPHVKELHDHHGYKWNRFQQVASHYSHFKHREMGVTYEILIVIVVGKAMIDWLIDWE